jgi:hypothetical protein
MNVMSSKSRRVRPEHSYPLRTTAVAGIVGLGVALLTTAASAASINSVAGKTGRIFIQISGEIVAGDSDLFIDAVKRANAAGKFVENVRLNSMGGNLLEGVKIADAIRTGKISTNVGQRSVCASECFLAFAAGDTKFASYGAQIGVHGASDQSGRETVQSGAATVSMARVAKDLGVPSAIIGRMVVTPPSEVVWLNPQDLQSMGVAMVGKPSQTEMPTADGTPIQQLPGAPRSLAPRDAPQANAATTAPTWNEILEKATNLSASQNNGKPALTRFCEPEFKVCTMAVTYKLKDGKSGFLKTVENMNGKMIRRESCELNEFSDIRTCLNWDTGASHRDMQNTKGEWHTVSDD